MRALHHQQVKTIRKCHHQLARSVTKEWICLERCSCKTEKAKENANAIVVNAATVNLSRRSENYAEQNLVFVEVEGSTDNVWIRKCYKR